MFFTPSKTKPPSSSPSTSTKKMTQAEKDALSAAAFGNGSSAFGDDEDNLFGGGASGLTVRLVMMWSLVIYLVMVVGCVSA